jgi:uncharacterized protein YbdZ (MbtH family)
VGTTTSVAHYYFTNGADCHIFIYVVVYVRYSGWNLVHWQEVKAATVQFLYSDWGFLNFDSMYSCRRVPQNLHKLYTDKKELK